MLEPKGTLNNLQLSFLELVANSELKDSFYLTGGTALCGFYIPYRLSEDLDFFSQDEFDIEAITIFIKSNQGSLKFQSYGVQTAFNRNLIFLDFKDQTLKTEFTYFPFPQKENPHMYNNLPVDTLADIALNKLFSIYQNPRLRDFMDLYEILLEQKYDFNHLILDSKVKFDWHIDKLQLGSQLLKAKTRKDAPSLVKDFEFNKMERFYEEQAKRLGQEITG